MAPHDYDFRGFIDRVIRQLLALATACLLLVWFSGFPNYFHIVYMPALTPVIWVAFTLCIALLCALAHDSWSSQLNSTFVVWWIVVLLINLAWYGGFGGGDTLVLNSRITNLVLLACAYFAFATCPGLIDRVRSGMAFLVVLAAGLNAYDFLNPGAFIPVGNEFQIFTRAAGIYMNPNIAGSVIVFGLLLSIDKVALRWRMVFVLACAVGVILTLSRAAILGLILSVVGLLVNGSLSRRMVWQLCAVFGAVATTVGLFFWPLISDLFGIFGLERILWFANPGSSTDFSSEERIFLAARGWEQFATHPLVGNGVGSTEYWVLPGSTHNQYLQYLSDFGFLGGLVVPALAIGLCAGMVPRYSTAYLVAGFVLFWALFSNNVLTDFSGLIAMAMTAALPRDVLKTEPARDHAAHPIAI